MRNEAMEPLDVLVGSWQATMLNAWFLESLDQTQAGSATGEWIGDAFLVFRWKMEDDVGTATSDMVLVLGRSDANDSLHGALPRRTRRLPGLRHDLRRVALEPESRGPRHVSEVHR